MFVFDAQTTLLEIKLIFCSSGFYAGAPTRAISCLPVTQQCNAGKIGFLLFVLIFLLAHLTVQSKALKHMLEMIYQKVLPQLFSFVDIMTEPYALFELRNIIHGRATKFFVLEPIIRERLRLSKLK